MSFCKFNCPSRDLVGQQHHPIIIIFARSVVMKMNGEKRMGRTTFRSINDPLSGQCAILTISLYRTPPSSPFSRHFLTMRCEEEGFGRSLQHIMTNNWAEPHHPRRMRRATKSEMPFSNDLWKFLGIQRPDWMEFWWRRRYTDTNSAVDMGQEFNSFLWPLDRHRRTCTRSLPAMNDWTNELIDWGGCCHSTWTSKLRLKRLAHPVQQWSARGRKIDEDVISEKLPFQLEFHE